MNGYIETLKADLNDAIEKQEQGQREEFNAGREDALRYAIEMFEKHELSNSHKHSVMQAEGSDGAKGAAVASRSVGAKRERELDDIWADLGDTLREMGNDEPEW